METKRSEQLLHSEVIGEGETDLLILHGLFGSIKNWRHIAGALSKNYRVHLLDLRNHGDSFHHNDHTIPLMTHDLRNYLQAGGIENFYIIGHSMGGLVAMDYAFQYPVKGIVVVDIAPKNYDVGFENEIKALEIDLSGLHTREEIDHQMARFVENERTRKFLQMNIGHDGDKYYWKINIEPLKIKANRSSIPVFDHSCFDGPTLFIAGGKSDFLQESDREIIAKCFPAHRFEVIEDGGHLLHYTHPEIFLRLVSEFIGETEVSAPR